MQIKALQAFSYREADGDIFSVALDEIVEMDSTLANGFIADGLAEEYSGGGSSDFSTAEVTVNGVGAFIANVATLTENGLSGLCFKSPLENSFTVVLYHGETIMEGVSETPHFVIPESETNIVYDEDNGWFLITGDCTITIS